LRSRPRAARQHGTSTSMDYSKLDANGDGVISKDEPRAMRTCIAVQRARYDKDGKLSSSEREGESKGGGY